MAFLKQEQINEIEKKITQDIGTLGKLYKSKKQKIQTQSVPHSMVEGLIDEGWKREEILKTKTKLSKDKHFARQFEDDIWCQFYELGYRNLNSDEYFVLPWGKENGQDKQIDVVAYDSEHVFLVECKSKDESSKRSKHNFKDDLDALSLRLDGFRKSIRDLLGSEVKVKYILATRNIKFDETSVDYKRLESTQSFHYSEHTYDYVDSLIKHYNTAKVKAAKYQFLGMIFRETSIGKKIPVPAISGSMGGKKYYSFSIEPKTLLKIGYILHRTKSNTDDFPTYQRLLKPNRLPEIRKFIQEGGYFPNSVIINFQTKNNRKFKLEFKSASQEGMSTSAKHGILKIPNAYAIAYIIDGQHRLYGYAGTEYSEKNQIPVVAFENMEEADQLDLFMKINEKQKAVPKSLIIALQKDMLWEAPLAADRLKALTSSVATEIADGDGPLAGRVSIGEQRTSIKIEISGDFIVRGLSPTAFNNGLLPKARGNKYDDKTNASLYDTNNQDHNNAMKRAQKYVVDLINECYRYIEENYAELFNTKHYFFVSSRGIYALIIVLGEINAHLIELKKIKRFASTKSRMEAMEKYLIALFEGVKKSSKQEQERILGWQGQGAHIPWIMYFIGMINKDFPDFNPVQYADYQERHDQELQENGRIYSQKIESHMKHVIIDTLKQAYKKDWEIEIIKWKRECEERASKEQEQNYKDGLGNETIDWKTKFTILQYKEIIQKFWSNMPDDRIDSSKYFQNIFTIDANPEDSKTEKVKWISQFNKYRNKIAHKGTNEVGLNKSEVDFLYMIYTHFKLDE